MVTDAFADAGRVAGLVEALRARTDQRSQIVAVHAGSVVGFVALSISWVDAPNRLVDVLTLSPVQAWPLPGYDPAIMHGPVVYNDTFWAYDCVGLRPDRPL